MKKINFTFLVILNKTMIWMVTLVMQHLPVANQSICFPKQVLWVLALRTSTRYGNYKTKL